jgi:archaellum component FlaC
MEYFNRDYYESQRQTEELLLIIVKQLEAQKSMLEALSVKVDDLTEFARKYENYNKENAGMLIEDFTVRPEEIDKLEEVCTYVEEGLSCIEADLAYNTGQIKMQEEKLNRLESHAKAHWGYPY